MNKWFTTMATALAMGGPAAVAAQEPVRADGAVTYTVAESFADVVFGVESAIVGRGLVIDHVSHVGEMLERTRADVGSEVVLYEQADVLLFCSATVSREVMEADPANIQFCPYGIFVYAMPGAAEETMVGYRDYPDGAMDVVEALLDGIVREAIGAD